MHAVPIQARALMRARVRMLERMKHMMAATATKTAVQAPCSERALSATEMLIIAEPLTIVKSKTR